MKHKQSTILLWQIFSPSGRMICRGPAVVQLPTCVQLFVTPWTAACQVRHPSPSPGVCPSSCPLHRWCHPAISFSDASSLLIPFMDHCLVVAKGLSNLMKLWTMPCRATQDGQVIVKSSERMWSIGGGNGKLSQYICNEPHELYKKTQRSRGFD